MARRTPTLAFTAKVMRHLPLTAGFRRDMRRHRASFLRRDAGDQRRTERGAVERFLRQRISSSG